MGEVLLRNWLQAQQANIQDFQKRVVCGQSSLTKWTSLWKENQKLQTELKETQTAVQQLENLQNHDSVLIRKMSQKLESLLLDNAQLRQDCNDSRLAELPASDDDHNQCIVCLEAARSHALVPCGHYIMCATCAAESLARNPECPCCRKPVEGVIRIYYA